MFVFVLLVFVLLLLVVSLVFVLVVVLALVAVVVVSSVVSVCGYIIIRTCSSVSSRILGKSIRSLIECRTSMISGRVGLIRTTSNISSGGGGCGGCGGGRSSMIRIRSRNISKYSSCSVSSCYSQNYCYCYY